MTGKGLLCLLGLFLQPALLQFQFSLSCAKQRQISDRCSEERVGSCFYVKTVMNIFSLKHNYITVQITNEITLQQNNIHVTTQFS